MFFQNWQSLLRTLIVTVLAYAGIVFLLRISGKRTLSKMNAFDFIVTIALGSALASVSLNKDIPLIEGILVFFLLIFLQYIISWLSVRISVVKRVVTSAPVMLLYKGKVLHEVMKKERITIEELYVSAREKGISSLEKVDIVVLETTGDITVIPKIGSGDAETLKSVKNRETGLSK
ncbi:hypothetical protein CHISP_3444 [Chitinispirillum alkaliphilum]|nr:hypothetical protein CHISP_3444 [Chitinispirillum alkaliphilum]